MYCNCNMFLNSISAVYLINSLRRQFVGKVGNMFQSKFHDDTEDNLVMKCE